jgi:hypothetical protein
VPLKFNLRRYAAEEEEDAGAAEEDHHHQQQQHAPAVTLLAAAAAAAADANAARVTYRVLSDLLDVVSADPAAADGDAARVTARVLSDMLDVVAGDTTMLSSSLQDPSTPAVVSSITFLPHSPSSSTRGFPTEITPMVEPYKLHSLDP